MRRSDFVRMTVRGCRRCPLYQVGNGPVPFRGPVPARWAIMGEAPGRKEDEAGQPFIGPSGEILAKTLSEVGLDIDDAFIFNTAQCWPQGTPQDEHVRACRINVSLQLKLSQATRLLVLGGTALQSWYPRWSLQDARGTFYDTPWFRSVWIFPTWHPAYVLRKPYILKDWREDLAKFAVELAADG